jgi:hypothetical protein
MTGGIAKVVEHLTSKCKALNSNSSRTTKKTKTKPPQTKKFNAFEVLSWTSPKKQKFKNFWLLAD